MWHLNLICKIIYILCNTNFSNIEILFNLYRRYMLHVTCLLHIYYILYEVKIIYPCCEKVTLFQNKLMLHLMTLSGPKMNWKFVCLDFLLSRQTQHLNQGQIKFGASNSTAAVCFAKNDSHSLIEKLGVTALGEIPSFQYFVKGFRSHFKGVLSAGSERRLCDIDRRVLAQNIPTTWLIRFSF